MKSIFYVVVCGFVLSLLPLGAHAYQSTKQSAVRVNDSTALYTIEYDFGFLNADVWLPIVARRDMKVSTSTPQLNYELKTVTGRYSEGTSHALVLSSAPIQNGRYYIPRGERANFSLVAVVHSPATPSSASEEVSLAVTALTHVMRKDGEFVLRNLDATTLADYVTPAIPLQTSTGK